MNVIDILHKNGFVKIETDLISKKGDEISFRKSIRRSENDIDRSGVYVFVATDETGNIIPVYVGSSSYLRDRLLASRIVYRTLRGSALTNISVYTKYSEQHLWDESILIDTINPIYNVNRPWRPREVTIII